jgi:PAS domain S-box-containing protein
MFFKKTAQRKGDKRKNPFIAILADSYLEHSLKYQNEKKVKDALKGKFPALRYTLSGFDSSELPYEDKVRLISVLYDFNIREVGPIEAKGTLEELGLKAKERLGIFSGFEAGLSDLPEEVFEAQRLKGLTKKDLEERAKKLLYELEKAKAISSRGIAEQTVEIVAERDVLESILYNTSDGVYSLDRTGKIITFNKAMEDLTGYTFEEVENQKASEYIRLFDATEPLETLAYCAMEGVTPVKVAFTRDKLTLVSRNGAKKYVKMTSGTISEGRQVNIGCIVTLTDVTKNIELETMKLDFVSIAAHELRTPLTAMRGYLALLNEEVKQDMSYVHAGYLEKSVLSADRLHILIENLLNISRIEKGTLILDITKQDWVSVVEGVVEELVPNAEASNLELVFVKPKRKIPKAYVDITTIVEVLSNLLDNSIRYTEAGGKITITVERDKDMVVTHVEDTGIGIPQASIPHIFKKFYRVSTTVLRAGEKGTGLGLFISGEIVKMHGGEIWVESKEGEGSVFSFSLPTKAPKKGKK